MWAMPAEDRYHKRFRRRDDMSGKIFAAAATLVLCASVAFADGDKDKDKDKGKKTDNSETYTVHKSGDASNGVPTYSTGGLNPNPEKPKKDKPKKEEKKK